MHLVRCTDPPVLPTVHVGALHALAGHSPRVPTSPIGQTVLPRSVSPWTNSSISPHRRRAGSRADANNVCSDGHRKPVHALGLSPLFFQGRWGSEQADLNTRVVESTPRGSGVGLPSVSAGQPRALDN